MPIRAGVPLVKELDDILGSEFYRAMLAQSERFLAAAARPLRRYRWSPAANPLRNWSRRWEYPFVAERLLAFAGANAEGPFRLLDAGSGVTFFPYFLAEQIDDAQVVCCDSNPSYERAFNSINAALHTDAVRFVRSGLDDIPLADASVDAICCISVLEHAGGHTQILDKFRRVLRPGGLLTVTFDVSVDGRGRLLCAEAEKLGAALGARFTVEEGCDVAAELRRLDRPEDILTTDHVRRTRPELLPWKHPVLKSFYDLVRGRGWSGGFYSLACCGLAARRP